ncbi:hypothetical protein [Endozoicomonas sp. 8E]|uniref:hypothetical protein n=1 Tax=Endozoicomonas sp. 8E TaxID=3035692 RepID=UPI00293910FC|nr:hypothetical protein [Endozoicomonas sp. 8E]WOG28843.1 hypothetical protein P6910_04055 [Endozoicomonas sp. 8E]
MGTSCWSFATPAKAGIHTDSPPEPYCPVPPRPCHPREGRDPTLALDSRLRGNDDLRAWERAVGVLRHPRRRESTLTHHQNYTARCPPWPCHPREGRDPPLALDSRLRGNDDLRAWERAVGVLRHPRRRESTLTHHQNHTARCPPGLVIPEKAETHTWPWIPAFAGMTTL